MTTMTTSLTSWRTLTLKQMRRPASIDPLVRSSAGMEQDLIMWLWKGIKGGDVAGFNGGCRGLYLILFLSLARLIVSRRLCSKNSSTDRVLLLSRSSRAFFFCHGPCFALYQSHEFLLGTSHAIPNLQKKQKKNHFVS